MPIVLVGVAWGPVNSDSYDINGYDIIYLKCDRPSLVHPKHENQTFSTAAGSQADLALTNAISISP